MTPFWRHRWFRLLLLGAFVLVGTVCCIHWMTFAMVQNAVLRWSKDAADHPEWTIPLLFTVQAIGMLFSLPTKALFTLASGALLGAVLGGAVTMAGVLAGTSGLFFAVRRILLPEPKQLDPRLEKIRQRAAQRPIRTIAGLRLILTLPYGPITVMAALTPMSYGRFLLGSLTGDLPVVALYALAGERLYQLRDSSDAVSWSSVAILCTAGTALFISAIAGQKKKSD